MPVSPAIAPVDIESVVCGYLAPYLGVLVSTRVPNPDPDPMPKSWVRVTRAGGQPRNLVQTDIRLLVECWAVSETDAFDLARWAYAYLWAAQYQTLGLPDTPVHVMAVGFSEPVNFPDPSQPDYS